jgi:MFS family permease
MQGQTPIELVGRVSASVFSLVSVAQLMGLVLSGVLAQSFGIRPVFLLCAVLAWALTGAGKLLLGSDGGLVFNPPGGPQMTR